MRPLNPTCFREGIKGTYRAEVVGPAVPLSVLHSVMIAAMIITSDDPHLAARAPLII